MNDSKLNQPAFTLTVGEFIEILRNESPFQLSFKKSEIVPEQPQFLYSIKQLADYLHCSTVKAQQLKHSGKIRFVQYGRKLRFSTTEIIEDLQNIEKYKQ